MLCYTFLGSIPVAIFEQGNAKILEIIILFKFGIINEKNVVCAPSFLENHRFCL